MKALRQRRAPKLIPEQVATLARTTRPTVNRMESGDTLPSVHLLGTILGVYAATEDEREEAIRLWEYANADTTVVEHAADLSPKYLAFRWDESEAVSERTMEPVAIHGLLQTAGYASAIADAAGLFNQNRPADWEQRAADERQARQRLLGKDGPLALHSLIDEGVIRRVVGGADVMAEQLRHLLTVGAQDNVTIQVVPFAAGAYGTMSGPVSILSFAEDDGPDLAYLEHAAGGESVENRDDVAAFISTFERISRNLALPPDQSADLIKGVLDRLEGR
ncbi:MAG TPA: helix-turn-helix transcriptional regulator [Pseudonocardiaceae bacterium]|nr:helix-turn-helix transcriptional regulator [Pseudonocardiaceae bacterium]